MCDIVVLAVPAAGRNDRTVLTVIAVAGVFAVAWVARILIVCLARKDGDDLGRALDAVRPAREFRWWIRRSLSGSGTHDRDGRHREKGKNRRQKKHGGRKKRRGGPR